MSISTIEPTASNCTPPLPQPTHHDPGFPLSKASEKVTGGNVHIFGVCMQEKPVELPVPSRQKNRVPKSTHSYQPRTNSHRFSSLWAKRSSGCQTCLGKNSDRPHQANKIFQIWIPSAASVSGWVAPWRFGSIISSLGIFRENNHNKRISIARAMFSRGLGPVVERGF